MDKIVIEGGQRLEGELSISGAKNGALPALAASLLCPGEFVFHSVPSLKDITTINTLLMVLGAKVAFDSANGRVTVDTSNLSGNEAPYDLVRTMRASCLVLGPLLARTGEARISLPGGCAIGERPINLHIMGFEKLGAKIVMDHGYIEARAPGGLKGSNINFETVTVTGTANLMMAAVMADGVTLLENAAREPEVVFLAEMLNKMGAEISGAGTRRISIKGKKKLHPVEISILPDRVETGTFMAAAAITAGNIKLNGCNPAHLEAVTDKLKEAGCGVSVGKDFIEVKGVKRLSPLEIETETYPGFPTDMQAQMMALLLLANGKSVITETIFENRFMHVAELRRMGAKIRLRGRKAFVQGVDSLSGAKVMATDLRASASLIIAGLAAEGKTELKRVYHLDRGYQRIEEKLKMVGANIERMPDSG